jgi:hypothetical protein
MVSPCWEPELTDVVGQDAGDQCKFRMAQLFLLRHVE